MVNFTLPVNIDLTNLLKPVNQGCLNTRNTAKICIANHFCVWLSLSKNTLSTELTPPVQYSSGGLSKIVDLPNSVEIKIDTSQHYKLTSKHVTEFLKSRETV